MKEKKQILVNPNPIDITILHFCNNKYFLLHFCVIINGQNSLICSKNAKTINYTTKMFVYFNLTTKML
jgi:hypothetical protein